MLQATNPISNESQTEKLAIGAKFHKIFLHKSLQVSSTFQISCFILQIAMIDTKNLLLFYFVHDYLPNSTEYTTIYANSLRFKLTSNYISLYSSNTNSITTYSLSKHLFSTQKSTTKYLACLWVVGCAFAYI